MTLPNFDLHLRGHTTWFLLDPENLRVWRCFIDLASEIRFRLNISGNDLKQLRHAALQQRWILVGVTRDTLKSRYLQQHFTIKVELAQNVFVRSDDAFGTKLIGLLKLLEQQLDQRLPVHFELFRFTGDQVQHHSFRAGDVVFAAMLIRRMRYDPAVT